MVDLGFVIDVGFLTLLIYGMISLIAFVFAAIDIVRARRNVKHKIVWLSICIVLGAVGVVIYYFIEKKKGKVSL